jgi:hypothetical protein
MGLAKRHDREECDTLGLKAPIASSTDRSDGLWLPAVKSLKVGRYSKKSWRMNRAETVSPPVSCLMRDSAQRRPSSVSVAVTMRSAVERAKDSESTRRARVCFNPARPQPPAVVSASAKSAHVLR